jgi:hypothetical protein
MWCGVIPGCIMSLSVKLPHALTTAGLFVSTQSMHPLKPCPRMPGQMCARASSHESHSSSVLVNSVLFHGWQFPSGEHLDEPQTSRTTTTTTTTATVRMSGKATAVTEVCTVWRVCACACACVRVRACVCVWVLKGQKKEGFSRTS